LRAHLRDFGGAPGGRIFAGVQGRELASITYRPGEDDTAEAGLTDDSEPG
jgi:hypothetical protein